MRHQPSIPLLLTDYTIEKLSYCVTVCGLGIGVDHLEKVRIYSTISNVYTWTVRFWEVMRLESRLQYCTGHALIWTRSQAHYLNKNTWLIPIRFTLYWPSSALLSHPLSTAEWSCKSWLPHLLQLLRSSKHYSASFKILQRTNIGSPDIKKPTS